ncbi:hypothetical protein ElyMa_001809700 [Elysia marginata]|uniref:Uncharacterized protein n=1 Tax=Elysia marginata TaxID=1093978 RepID=A0AAV4EH94_9GAST|nr:hypothetical protein ElyMa_001809700 [Elysia marginata]
MDRRVKEIQSSSMSSGNQKEKKRGDQTRNSWQRAVEAEVAAMGQYESFGFGHHQGWRNFVAAKLELSKYACLKHGSNLRLIVVSAPITFPLRENSLYRVVTTLL